MICDQRSLWAVVTNFESLTPPEDEMRGFFIFIQKRGSPLSLSSSKFPFFKVAPSMVISSQEAKTLSLPLIMEIVYFPLFFGMKLKEYCFHSFVVSTLQERVRSLFFLSQFACWRTTPSEAETGFEAVPFIPLILILL